MIFIAGDFKDKNETKQFDEAEKHLIELEKYHQIYKTKDIINPNKVVKAMPFLDERDRLDLYLLLLQKCDIIYMLASWEYNIDARILHDYASVNGYKIVYSKKF